MSVDFGTRRTAFITTAILTNVYYFSTAYLFFSRADRPAIQKRMVSLCALIFGGTIVTGNVTLIMTALFTPVVPVPCGFRLIVQTLFAPLWLFGNFLRAVNLLYMSMVNQVMYDVLQASRVSPLEKLPRWKRVFLRMFSSRHASGIKHLVRRSQNSNEGSEMSRSIAHSEKVELMSFSSEIRFKVILKWITGFFGVCLVALIIEIAIFPNQLHVPSCSVEQMYGRYLLQTMVLVATTVTMFFVKDIQDCRGLKWEIWASNLIILPLFFLYLLGSSFLSTEPMVTVPPIGATLWTNIAHFLAHTTNIVWPLIDSYRDDWAIEKFLRTSGRQTQEAMMESLRDPILFRNFKQELVLEMAMENALYLEAYFKLLRKVETNPAFSLQSQLLAIQRSFISQNSTYALNLPSKLRKLFDIELEKGNCSVQILQPITDHISHLLYSNTYPRFIKKHSHHTNSISLHARPISHEESRSTSETASSPNAGNAPQLKIVKVVS